MRPRGLAKHFGLVTERLDVSGWDELAAGLNHARTVGPTASTLRAPQLLVALRLWRRRQRAAWLKVGRPRPEWVFSSVTGTALDESNVRKAFNRLLDAAGLRRRGPHQMRHTFASLLLAAGEPITYVSRQLGHHDASITLRVYAHWLPDTSARKGVDRLDDTQASATPAQPEALTVNERNQLSALSTVVSRVGIEPTTRRLRVCCSAN